MEQIRVIKEMREADAKRGRTDQLIRPRYMVWENVPGAFSSNKGQDFAAVLEETIRIIEPEIPCIEVPEHGWPTWGGYRDLAGRWSVAWRVLDAQYWGVPQRRRRIALVADFGGDTAHKILFNSKGVSGDSEESGAQEETTARETETGVGDSGDGVTCYGIRSVDSNSMKSENPNSGFYEAETSRCLDANGGNPTCNQGGIAVVAYCIQGNAIDRADTAGCNGKGWTEGVSYTLNTIDRPAVAVTFSKDAHGQYAENDVSATSTANHDGGGEALIVESDVLCLNDQGGAAMSVSENKTGTLRSETHGHEPLIFNPAQRGDVLRIYEGKSPSLTSFMGTGGGNVPLIADSFAQDAYDKYSESAVSASLKRAGGNSAGGSETLVATYQETTGPLMANTHPGSYSGQDAYNDMFVAGAQGKKTVRRLTVLECERLQGFPDNWTDIGEWTDAKGKKRDSSDSARYKAIGNSIAIPVWKWVLKRICAEYERDATLGSLFDGIGGFPLIWEQLNGKGSCKWASEVEPFCIAVTEFHFGKDKQDCRRMNNER